MNCPCRALPATLAVLLTLTCVSLVSGQAVAPPEPSPADAAAQKGAKKPLPKKVVEDMITLTPFEVSADLTDTYDATNTNSVTGTNTALY